MAKKSKKKVEQKPVDHDSNHDAANKYKAAEILLFQRIDEAFDELLEAQKSIVLMEEMVPPVNVRAAVTIVSLAKFLAFKHQCFDMILQILNISTIPQDGLSETVKAAVASTDVNQDQVLSKESDDTATGDIQST